MFKVAIPHAPSWEQWCSWPMCQSGIKRSAKVGGGMRDGMEQ